MKEMKKMQRSLVASLFLLQGVTALAALRNESDREFMNNPNGFTMVPFREMCQNSLEQDLGTVLIRKSFQVLMNRYRQDSGDHVSSANALCTAMSNYWQNKHLDLRSVGKISMIPLVKMRILSLDLSGNQFTSEDIFALSLENDQIESFIKQNIVNLDLSHNFLTKSINLNHFETLQHLNISYNQLTEAPVFYTSVISLNLSNNATLKLTEPFGFPIPGRGYIYTDVSNIESVDLTAFTYNQLVTHMHGTRVRVNANPENYFSYSFSKIFYLGLNKATLVDMSNRIMSDDEIRQVFMSKPEFSNFDFAYPHLVKLDARESNLSHSLQNDFAQVHRDTNGWADEANLMLGGRFCQGGTIKVNKGSNGFLSSMSCSVDIVWPALSLTIPANTEIDMSMLRVFDRHTVI